MPQLTLSVGDRFHHDLLSLPRDAQKRVLRALRELRSDPTRQAEPLKGADNIWRRRADPYRILFCLGSGWIHVFTVEHRRSVYRREFPAPIALPSSHPPDTTVLEQEGEDTALQEPASIEHSEHLWDDVAKLVLSQDPEDLYNLIDLGLPEPLFDELFARLQEEHKRVTHPTNIHLVKRSVIDSFFGRVLRMGGQRRPNEMIIISPWITPWSGEKSSFAGLLRYLETQLTRTTLVTRPPSIPAHGRAVEALSGFASVEIIYLEDLHAKFFICDIAPVPFALIGSANSTAQSLSNLEVGVFVRGSGEAEGLVRDLEGLAVELRAIGKRVKRRNRS